MAGSVGAGLIEWTADEAAPPRCDGTALRLLGLASPPGSGPLLDAVHPVDRANLRDVLDGWRRGEDAAGVGAEVETRLTRSGERSERWVRWVLRASGAGRDRRLAGLVIDVSAAKEKEAQLSRIAQSARLVVWEMDLETHWTRCSPNAAAIWGFHEGPGAAFFERIHPEDRDQVRPGGGGERAYVREYRVFAVNGETLWLQARGDVVCDADGRPVRMLGVSVDITDRKRVEQAALEVGERLERAQQAARFGTWDWDLITGHAIWSDGIYDLIGVPRRSFPPDTERWKQFIHPEDLDGALERVREAVERGGDFNFEFRVRRPDGAVRWVGSIGRVDRGPDGRGARLLGINIDVTERRLLEETQRRGERQFRTLFETAAVGAALADPASGRLLAVNPALGEMSGFAADELLGRSFCELVHPDDRGADEAGLAALSRGEADQWRGEMRLLRKDGATQWGLVSAGLVRHEDGRPWRVTAFVIDITDRKRTEAALREAQARERAYLEHLPVGVWFLAADGRITYGNQAGRDIWGGARYVGPERFGEYKGWWHGTDRRIAAEEWGAARAIRRGETSLEEVIDIECFDGTRKTILNSAVPVRGADGAVAGAVLFNQDITALKEAERKSKDNESTLRSFYESSPLLMGVVDIPPDNSDIRHLYANAATERFFGAAPGGMEGRGARDLGSPPEVVSRWVRHYRLSEAEGRPVQFEYAHNQITGALWLACVVSCIGPTEGGRVRFSYVAQDITVRKQMELELVEAQAALRRHAARLEQAVADRTAELREANEQLETFVYSVAHDLRGPLRAVTGFSQLLAEDHGPRLDETGRHMLGRIQGASEFMDRLVLDLLAFGRAARAEIELAPVSVAKAWETAWFQCAVDAERCGARVEVAEPLPMVRGHEGTLGQMLANLLGNALKFARPGEPAVVRFWAEERGERVRLWVEDQGIGIEPEQHERVFRVFERLHGGRYSGTGVGLAIVRKGAERMGGRAGVESAPGAGSRFWIELPRA